MKKHTLYNKFLGSLIKKGNKIGAKRVLHEAFLKASRQTGLSVHILLLRVFCKLNTFVEIKRVRKKRSVHLVPFSITFKRRSYLVVKWLMQVIKADTRHVSTSEKLFNEIQSTLSKFPSKSFKIRNQNISQSLLSRSNIHFRW
jgi:ribosomal protein S7